MTSHIDQWRSSQNTDRRDELINQWLGTQWSITFGDAPRVATLIGELTLITDGAYPGERDNDPAFTIETTDGLGYTMIIKAHFAQFEPMPEEMHEYRESCNCADCRDRRHGGELT